jgi:cysteine desulfurase/selenocysteine lyase
MTNFTILRDDFPLLKQTINGKRIVYLDSSATSLKPTPVIDAMNAYYTQFTANIHRGIYELSETATRVYEDARATIAAFIGAKGPSEVVFTRNATEAVNLLATSIGKFGIQTHDSIVVTQLEHHANFVPWQQVALDKKAEFKVVPINKNGYIEHNTLNTYVNRSTKVFCFTAVSNVLGTIQNISDIITTVRSLSPSCIIVIDAAQAVPHMAVDVAVWGADCIVFSGHKMLGPTGIGVLWAKESLLNELPPYQYGGDMVTSVTATSSSFQQAPQKFEAGTPAIAEAIGLAESCRYLKTIGFDAIHAHEQTLLAYALPKLRTIKGLRLIGNDDTKNRIGVIPFTIAGIHPHDIAQVLNEDNICIRAGHHCAMPIHTFLGLTATARASLYIYTTKADIDSLSEGLKKVTTIFK